MKEDHPTLTFRINTYPKDLSRILFEFYQNEVYQNYFGGDLLPVRSGVNFGNKIVQAG